jgi:hypothetical protein
MRRRTAAQAQAQAPARPPVPKRARRGWFRRGS